MATGYNKWHMFTSPRSAAVYLRVSLDATGEGLAVEREREKCLSIRAVASVHEVDRALTRAPAQDGVQRDTASEVGRGGVRGCRSHRAARLEDGLMDPTLTWWAWTALYATAALFVVAAIVGFCVWQASRRR